MKTTFLYQFILVVWAVFLFNACKSKSTKEEQPGFVVKGLLKNYKGDALVLEELTATGLVFIDSTPVEPDGSFELHGNNREKTFYVVKMAGNTLPLVMDTNTVVNVEVDMNDPSEYKVSGSEDNNTLKALITLNDRYANQLNDLSTKYQYPAGVPMPDSIQNLVHTRLNAIMAERKQMLIRFVDSIPNSIVAFFATSFLINEQDPALQFELLDRMDRKYYPLMPGSKYVQANHNKVEVLRKTAVGSVAPDIVLNDPNSVPVALSSMRGKIVLLDFWASWCGPCREENPNTLRLYERYKSEGFDVYAVSLDDNREEWMKAIEKDRLTWTHVSDLQKWNSSVIAKYNIESIPHTLLLDKEGKIIARNLRGKALEDKLKELFD